MTEDLGHRSNDGTCLVHATDSFNSPSDCHRSGCRKLRSVVGQIETFLLVQMERLEREILAPATDVEPVDRGGDLTADRRRWEEEREREVARLRSEADRLTNAWHELESEQRKLLAQKENRSLGMAESAREIRQTETVERRPSSRRQSVPDRPVPIDDELLSAEMAAIQFQQMRREMQRHRSRR
jgi:hypothetical protein